MGGSVAPVLILTCHRLAHFRNLLRSLGKCALARRTRCYIAIDLPPEKRLAPEHAAIVRLSRQNRKFLKTELLIRKKNLGPAKNYEDALGRVFRRYDRVVVLEDDNIVSKNFLLFMNQALAYFQNDNRCFGICGHTYIAHGSAEPTDAYPAFYFCGWGSGIYRDRQQRHRRFLKRGMNRCFLSLGKVIRCLRQHPHVFRIYVEGLLRGQSFGDVELSVQALEENGFFVYPTKTKVINRGHDGSGVRVRETRDPFPKKIFGGNQTKFRFGFDRRTTNRYLAGNCRKLCEYLRFRFRRFLKLYSAYLWLCFQARKAS